MVTHIGLHQNAPHGFVNNDVLEAKVVLDPPSVLGLPVLREILMEIDDPTVTNQDHCVSTHHLGSELTSPGTNCALVFIILRIKHPSEVD